MLILCTVPFSPNEKKLRDHHQMLYLELSLDNKYFVFHNRILYPLQGYL